MGVKQCIHLLVMLASLAGCTGAVVKQPLAPEVLAAQLRPAPTTEYQIKSSDELDIRFFYTPELNASVTVRPDGKINLPIIGDLHAAGLSATALAALLKKSYAAEIKRPDATVNIRGFVQNRVFVGGEVGHSGMQQLVGPVSVLQALIVAEGMKDSANTREVVIIRRTDGNERLVFSVNMDSVISGSDTSQDILLQPFDVVVVPRSGISNVNTWVDLYIRKNLPINTGFSYTINRNKSVSQQ